MTHFPDQLLSWRRHRGVTQSHLAKRSGTPQPNIAALEAGRLDPRLSTLVRLAEALNLSVGDLLDRRPPSRGWGRHHIDTLVRGAIDPSLLHGKGRRPLEEALRIVISQKLAAAGQSIKTRGRTGERLVKQLRADLGPRLWNSVIRRVDKLL